MQDWLLGLFVGLVPTLSMLTGSLLLMRYEVRPLTEACFQNFCAGLILAAVAGELFPLAVSNESRMVTLQGISFGFIGCLLFIHGVDYFIHYLQEIHEEQTSLPKDRYSYESIPEDEHWDLDPVRASVAAINESSHRSKVKLDLILIHSAVDRILEHANSLVHVGDGLSLTREGLAEEIDAEIHGLQYIVDRTRRHLEGSGTQTMTPYGLSDVAGITK